jgi:predicted amidohydrolase
MRALYSIQTEISSRLSHRALLQLVSNENDQEANLKKGDLYCRKAKELGADIILFPEMWNIGYTPFNQDIFHHDFTSQHAVTYAEDIKKWQSQAVSLDSHFVQHFRILAKELNVALANYAAPQENGHSCAFDGIPFDQNGKSKDMTIVIADHNEKIILVEFDLEQIRQWRISEGWGNAYRKPKQYQSLVSLEVSEPFVRDNARR